MNWMAPKFCQHHNTLWWSEICGDEQQVERRLEYAWARSY